jgi:hypothetical protein
MPCARCKGNDYTKHPDGSIETPCCTCATDDVPDREWLLLEAAKIIKGDRYGGWHDNATRTAAGWEQILGCTVSPAQVALCLDWLKTSRLVASPHHVDSWKDKAGYTALGYECSDV